ncbi:3-hydroxyacyl-CoA dehydrogenase/enoyl-CoA hydratase family protein [Azospirillum griseum]|uniref:3-hydroxyacyl-CoA dehydrogenase/enoyl-CoA hydratase family protein n=2 Tax=Azospirillum griseum TaxID=2496639 RepID=A0A3S0R574_9PROT|nr:3-hydroxyacyl-CoA dehydrogenase/enoyl-CoA hydratase family protein [Azospirillum griseum]
MTINRVAVVGSGVMGSGIAAQIANAGVPVLLLDIVPETGAATGGDRSRLAKAALERLKGVQPAAFMSRAAAALVTPGNLEDDLGALADADWIIEAVIEDPEVKAALYRRIDTVRRAGSVVSSNTSTIPLTRLIDGQSPAFAQDFLISHFFNPPRYMRLMELVAGRHTRADAVAAITDFADRRLGKGVVSCNDGPGFIANRIGTYWMYSAIGAAFDLGVAVEEADALLSQAMGVPRTGVFGLVDLVGLDLMPHIARSFRQTLPLDDDFRQVYRDHERLRWMIDAGLTGRKGKGGFYRTETHGGIARRQAMDLDSGLYRPLATPTLPSVAAARQGLRAALAQEDRGGRFLRRVLLETLGYAAGLVPGIADSVRSVDEAMRLGYNWSEGPFALIDRVGAEWLADALRAEGRLVPPLLALADRRPFHRVADGRVQHLTVRGDYADAPVREGVVALSDVKRGRDPVARSESAALWDLGDGVLCLEFTTKSNSLDVGVMTMILHAVEVIGDGRGAWTALVIHNEGENFSVGANLDQVRSAAKDGRTDDLLRLNSVGQTALMAMKRAPFPVVGAAWGMALGGGCEILLHCDHVQAHADLVMGLVETRAGLIPGWGGCKELLARRFGVTDRPAGPMEPIKAAFESIRAAKVSGSAAEAKELGFLRPSDGVTFNRDRLLADAKAAALALVPGYSPPRPIELRLPGPTAALALRMGVDALHAVGRATVHDVAVAKELAEVLSGGRTDLLRVVGEDDLLALERTHILRLIDQPASVARMDHLLATGKPLRN